MNTQLRNSIIAIVCSTVIGTALFWPWGGLSSDAATSVEIEDREYDVWRSVILAPSAQKDRPNVVLQTRVGGCAGLPGPYTIGIGQLVLSLGVPAGEEIPGDSEWVASEDYDRAREAVADFARKMSREWVIQDRFSDVSRVQLAGKDGVPTIWGIRSVDLSELRKRFPEADELMQVSRVGFSTDGSIAVVYRARRSSATSGLGAILVLKAVDGAFKLVARYGCWIS